MFNKIILVIYLFALAINMQAQSFGGGIALGAVSSQVGGDNLAGFNKAGLFIGIFANKSISDFLSFQMEMNFIQKGSNNANMNDDQHKNSEVPDISLSYVELPLLLKYNQSNKSQIELGIQAGYLINGFYNDIYGKIEYNNTPPFRKYDVGLMLGFNYRLSKNINLNTRLSNSILPIGTEDYDNPELFNSSIKGKYNSVLSFALYYNLS